MTLGDCLGTRPDGPGTFKALLDASYRTRCGTAPSRRPTHCAHEARRRGDPGRGRRRQRAHPDQRRRPRCSGRCWRPPARPSKDAYIVGLSSDTADRARQTAKLVGGPRRPIPRRRDHDTDDDDRNTKRGYSFRRAEGYASTLITTCSRRWASRPGSARITAAPRPSTCRCSTCSGRRSAGSSTR